MVSPETRRIIDFRDNPTDLKVRDPMIQTWLSSEAEDFTCKSCGSVYAVSIHRLPAKDADSENCEVCGSVLQKWNSTRVPSFKLKIRGNPPPNPAS
jgi:hypothetical protein